MKKIIRILFLAILVVSCEKDLNINDNPNTPTNVDKSFVITAAQGSLATVLGGDLTNLGGFMAQYHTQAPSASQYLNIDSYNLNTDYANTLWSELYSGCLNDLNYVKSESEEVGETGSYLIATLLEAYTYQVLTDLFGDIPYSESILGSENISPKSDPGNEIYLSLITKIDNALSKYNNNPVASTFGSQDAVYESSMEDWVKFGNTLKLKLYMRMSYTDQANASAVNALLAQDNFIENDAKFALYNSSQEENKNNPFYDVQIQRLGDVNNVGSASLIRFYTENADPRVDVVYRKNKNDVIRPLDQGDRASFSSEKGDDFSRPNVLPGTPVYLLTVSESNFLQAEALIRYSGGANAAAKYEEGVVNSFLTYGLNPAAAQALVGTGGVYEYVPSADVEQAVRQVMIQKWASLAYVNTIEAFFEVRRTKFPETLSLGSQDYAIGNLIVSENSVLPGDQTPNSLFYPSNEVLRNSNLDQKSSVTEKIWWDQK